MDIQSEVIYTPELRHDIKESAGAAKSFSGAMPLQSVCQNYLEKFPIKETELHTNIVDLIMHGSFASKGREKFPVKLPSCDEFKLRRGEGDRCLYGFSDLVLEDQKLKQGYSMVFVPATEQNNLSESLFAVAFDKCLFSNMTDQVVPFPISYFGHKRLCKANCPEAFFKIMAALFCDDPSSVIEKMFRATTVPDLKKAQTSAKGFDGAAWDRVSKAAMLRAILYASSAEKSYFFSMFRELIVLGNALKSRFLVKEKGIKYCIFECPSFKDDVWGSGTNIKGFQETVGHLFEAGETRKIVDMCEHLLKDTFVPSNHNVFSRVAKNQLGECLTFVLRMLHQWSEDEILEGISVANDGQILRTMLGNFVELDLSVAFVTNGVPVREEETCPYAQFYNTYADAVKHTMGDLARFESIHELVVRESYPLGFRNPYDYSFGMLSKAFSEIEAASAALYDQKKKKATIGSGDAKYVAQNTAHQQVEFYKNARDIHAACLKAKELLEVFMNDPKVDPLLRGDLILAKSMTSLTVIVEKMKETFEAYRPSRETVMATLRSPFADLYPSAGGDGGGCGAAAAAAAAPADADVVMESWPEDPPMHRSGSGPA